MGKGMVENFNGLVRQYFSKGTKFLDISEARLSDIQAELKLRPRKGLGYQSPHKLKHELTA
jgi:IS30 family transposase